MKIQSFSKATCLMLSGEVEAMLKPIEEKYGVVVRYKGGSFGAGSFVAKVEIATKGENGEVNSREADDFKRFASSHDLSPDDLGCVFRSGGRDYKVVGFRAKARTRPIIVECGGRRFTFRAEDVLRLLPARTATATTPTTGGLTERPMPKAVIS